MMRSPLTRKTPLPRGHSIRRGTRLVYRPDPTDAALDTLCADYVKQRDTYTCQWPTCGRVYAPGSRGLQWAHLISRRHKKTRWNPEASVALCTAHHFWLDGHPHEKIVFAVARLGQERYDLLRARSTASGTVDRLMVKLTLQARMRDLELVGE